MATILEHLIRAQLWRGKKVVLDDDGLFSISEEAAIGVDKETGARITGDPVIDQWERMVADGHDPFDLEASIASSVSEIARKRKNLNFKR